MYVLSKLNSPAFASNHESQDAMGQANSSASQAEVLRNAGPAVSTILSHIRDAPNEPLIVHCSAGKDRTGIAVALALKLAGCSEEVVSQEYAMTELSIAEQAKRAEALISQKIAEQPAEGEQSKKDDEPGDLRSQLLKAAGLSGKEADRAGGRLKARYVLSSHPRRTVEERC